MDNAMHETESQTILVVDDNVQNLKLLESLLQQAGYRVRPALNGATALHAAAVSPPALILLDINMPGMNGFEVCRSLKEDENLRNIPVIFISALNDTSDKIEAFECGGVDYVTKPFQFRELQARLETHLTLHDLRQDLELRVCQRTSELEEANRRLQHEMEERKRQENEKSALEKRLRQAEKMESLGLMASGISHDFNNLLAPIIGYCDLLEASLPEDDSKNRDRVRKIIKAGMQGKDMIQQILSFSRKSSSDRVVMEMYPLVQEAIFQLEAVFPENFSILPRLDKKCGRILGDGSQLLQVITNIGINASHAMKDDSGTLTIELRRETFKQDERCRHYKVEPGYYICLELCDNGTGIEEELLERIFEPFYTTKEQGQGAGMGLSMVHGIIKTHCGSVTVESTPGQGSCFTIMLPRTEQKVAQPVPKTETAAPPPESGGRIMIIDDDSAMTVLFEEILKTAGYNPVTSNNSLAALELLTEQADDFILVLTDMNMPGMNGIELSQKISALNKELPIILISGNVEALDQDEMKNLGIRKQISKPVTMQQLLSDINEVL